VKPYRYHPAAERELDEAIEHDEAELPGRGLRLEDQVARLVLRLRRFPVSAPIWPRLDSAHEVRRAKVRRHPFLVVYMVQSDQLIILAVAHTKKKPGYWANRIDEATPPAARRTKRKSARSTSHAAAWKSVLLLLLTGCEVPDPVAPTQSVCSQLNGVELTASIWTPGSYCETTFDSMLSTLSLPVQVRTNTAFTLRAVGVPPPDKNVYRVEHEGRAASISAASSSSVFGGQRSSGTWTISAKVASCENQRVPRSFTICLIPDRDH
jgi:plasmid stabilization system protein ParE